MKKQLIFGALIVSLVAPFASFAAATPIPGVCGGAHYSCVLGDPSNMKETTAAWNWVCKGQGVGRDATCVESKKKLPGTKPSKAPKVTKSPSLKGEVKGAKTERKVRPAKVKSSVQKVKKSKKG